MIELRLFCSVPAMSSSAGSPCPSSDRYIDSNFINGPSIIGKYFPGLLETFIYNNMNITNVVINTFDIIKNLSAFCYSIRRSFAFSIWNKSLLYQRTKIYRVATGGSQLTGE